MTYNSTEEAFDEGYIWALKGVMDFISEMTITRDIDVAKFCAHQINLAEQAIEDRRAMP